MWLYKPCRRVARDEMSRERVSVRAEALNVRLSGELDAYAVSCKQVLQTDTRHKISEELVLLCCRTSYKVVFN